MPGGVERPSWPEDDALLNAQVFFRQHGHLNLNKHSHRKISKLSKEERKEDRLARSLDIVRRAKVQVVIERTQRYRKDRQQAKPMLLRRKLSAEDVAKWEQTLGVAWQWLPWRPKEQYLPGDCLSGSRHEWPRVPYFSKAAARYLCCQDFECKSQLIMHRRQCHTRLPHDEDTSLTDRRVEEEMRKRIFHDEAFEGPFEVRGQELRRIVGNHATHQTHSMPGSGCLRQDRPEHATSQQAHSLGGCAICARSFWAEDLYDLHVFTKPSDSGAKVAEPLANAASSGTFSVKPQCAEKMNQLLSIERYHKRFPKIPSHELYASSVQHPHVPGWRWLLHARRVPCLAANASGEYPPVPACRSCAYALSADLPAKVAMPRYALAGDNWIGRMPFAFTPDGKLLGEVMLKTLARGRMCVNKVIAEPKRCAHPCTKQGGLRGNSIAFPQA